VTRASQPDWAAVLERMIAGDRLALAQLIRLVNGFLTRWNAYDFRDEWEDLIQEVVFAAALALREERLRDRAATFAYLRRMARFKYVDRLKQQLRVREGESLPWAEWIERGLAGTAASPGGEVREDLHRALARVPEKHRASLLAVYVGGMTYEEAASSTGIPLGSLKRYLREALAQLRLDLGDALERVETLELGRKG
jgi:RNA polymerase sigma-70 factor (ECF subfamily)